MKTTFDLATRQQLDDKVPCQTSAAASAAKTQVFGFCRHVLTNVSDVEGKSGQSNDNLTDIYSKAIQTLLPLLQKNTEYV